MKLSNENVKRFKKADKARKQVLADRWGVTVQDIIDKYYTRSPRVHTKKVSSEPVELPEYYEFVGNSRMLRPGGFTKGKIYPIIRKHRLEADFNFTNDFGRPNGFSGANHINFKPSTKEAYNMQEGIADPVELHEHYKSIENNGVEFTKHKVYPITNKEAYNRQEGVIKSVEPVEDITILYYVDSSGSMFPYYRVNKSKGKFVEASRAVDKEVADFKDVSNIATKVFEFSSTVKEVVNGKWYYFANGTALNDTIMTSCKEAMKYSGKVLIKVFTDGIEMHSHNSINSAVKTLKKLPENVTFTFVTPEECVSNISKYEVDPSNCTTFENTEKGTKEVFERTTVATKEFVKKVAKGESVKSGFYKKLV